MVGCDFAYEQGVKTVEMNEHDRAVAVADINERFAKHYRDSYPRFASMYDNRATVFGRALTYSNMLSDAMKDDILFLY